MSQTAILVAADDDRVVALARSLDCDVVQTDPALASGSARVLAAAHRCSVPPAVVINVQGDAPFLPVAAVGAVRQLLAGGAEVATPVIRLGWPELDALREHKRTAPFSGTTCIVDGNGDARWFSKQVIPAMRNEGDLRKEMSQSPVYRHVGLYGYTLGALERFQAARSSCYETLEGLEQLRFLELGIPIRVTTIAPDAITLGGIDTMEDVVLAEQLIAKYGDPFGS